MSASLRARTRTFDRRQMSRAGGTQFAILTRRSDSMASFWMRDGCIVRRREVRKSEQRQTIGGGRRGCRHVSGGRGGRELAPFQKPLPADFLKENNHVGLGNYLSHHRVDRGSHGIRRGRGYCCRRGEDPVRRVHRFVPDQPCYGPTHARALSRRESRTNRGWCRLPDETKLIGRRLAGGGLILPHLDWSLIPFSRFARVNWPRSKDPRPVLVASACGLPGPEPPMRPRDDCVAIAAIPSGPITRWPRCRLTRKARPSSA